MTAPALYADTLRRRANRITAAACIPTAIIACIAWGLTCP